MGTKPFTFCDYSEGDSVPADDTIVFGVDGDDYTIDLSAGFAQKLRGEYASLKEAAKGSATIDGERFYVISSATMAEFRTVMADWKTYARPLDADVAEQIADAPDEEIADVPAEKIADVPADEPADTPEPLEWASLIRPGALRWWERPKSVKPNTKRWHLYRAMLAHIRTWGRDNGWPDIKDRARIPDALGEAYAVAHAPADGAAKPARRK